MSRCRSHQEIRSPAASSWKRRCSCSCSSGLLELCKLTKATLKGGSFSQKETPPKLIYKLKLTLTPPPKTKYFSQKEIPPLTDCFQKETPKPIVFRFPCYPAGNKLHPHLSLDAPASGHARGSLAECGAREEAVREVHTEGVSLELTLWSPMATW